MDTYSLRDALSAIDMDVGSGKVHVLDGDILELTLRECKFISTYIAMCRSLVDSHAEISSITFASRNGVLIRITSAPLPSVRTKPSVLFLGDFEKELLPNRWWEWMDRQQQEADKRDLSNRIAANNRWWGNQQ